MKTLALALAAGLFALSAPAQATMETAEAKAEASYAADRAHADMVEVFGIHQLQPNQFKWRKDAPRTGDAEVIVGLDEQIAYLYRGGELVAVASISSGKPGKDTPTGIFPILQKKAMHHSRKYDNAPMPFMQRLDEYGIALHAGYNPGEPASHGCVRLPKAFAAKLFQVTDVGDRVVIGS